MCNIPWILGDISFLSAISHGWMNKHMKFYQGQDKNIGGHGYLSVHRVVEYFIQLQDLKRMEETWGSSSIFSDYRQQYDKLSSEIQVKKDNQRAFFFQLMRNQINKHNSRYLKGLGLSFELSLQKKLLVH